MRSEGTLFKGRLRALQAKEEVLLLWRRRNVEATMRMVRKEM